MTPGAGAALAQVGLALAILGGGALLVLAVGWSVVLWAEAMQQRWHGERQRLLLVRLYELEVCCFQEFPQVRATAAYVRRLVLEEPGAGDVVAFRAGLRARYGEEEGEDG